MLATVRNKFERLTIVKPSSAEARPFRPLSENVVRPVIEFFLLFQSPGDIIRVRDLLTDTLGEEAGWPDSSGQVPVNWRQISRLSFFEIIFSTMTRLDCVATKPRHIFGRVLTFFPQSFQPGDISVLFAPWRVFLLG